jgi:hypothetical protein
MVYKTIAVWYTKLFKNSFVMGVTSCCFIGKYQRFVTL